MKILVIGGTGMVGGHAALHLRSLGHHVTISGRRPPDAVPALAELPLIVGDYLRGDFTRGQLGAFDAVVFAAGTDPRHVPEGEPADEHYLRTNGVDVPAFARLARDAGVGRFVNVGSFYPHVAPETIGTSAYVRSRKLAADGITALARPGFSACSLDAPFVVGTVPGMAVPMFAFMVQYAQGSLPIPPFAPRGGSNFISARSLSEAIAGALEHADAVSGKAVLVGDENLSFAAYFELFFRAAGNDIELPVEDRDHPLMPRVALHAGEKRIDYEPEPTIAGILGYRRKDIENAVKEITALYRS